MKEPDPPSKQLLIQGLEHDDFFVRSGAIALLGDDRDPGIEATHAAISAIERYGWEDAYDFSHILTKLPLDGEAVDRAVDWIRAGLVGTPHTVEPHHHLLDWLAKGPVDLFPRWTGPLGIDLEKARESFGEMPRFRAALRSKSAGECLDLLDQFLHECAVEGDSFPGGPASKVDWLCERLAEDGLPGDHEVAEWLDHDFQEDSPDSAFREYRVGAALASIRHQGRLAVPVAAVVRLFDIDWDWFNEEISKCLTQAAGRDEIIDILRLFPSLPWHARLFLCSVLENNRHPDLAEEITKTAAKEPSTDLPYRFAYILAAYGTPETRETARRMVASLPPSPEKEPVQQLLYTWCRLLREEWEELPQWREVFERGQFLLQEQTAPLRSMSPHLLHPSLHPSLHPESTKRELPKVGRNDPCHCGSGKKFKKCCLGQG